MKGRSDYFPTGIALAHFNLDRIICGGDKALIQARRASATALMTSWPAAYTNELVAMAAAAGVDQGALAYGNCFLDLSNAKTGCRSLVVVTNNLFLHAYNLDWDNLGGLAEVYKLFADLPGSSPSCHGFARSRPL